jgi:PAS domain S-box-containing protein
MTKVRDIYVASPAETFDVLEFADGRVFERFSKIQRIDNRNVGRVWSFRDITERKRAERELRDQSEWFKVTLGSIGDGVITVDKDCRITFVNSIAEKLTGWDASDAIGRTVGEVLRIVKEATQEEAPNPIDRALAEGIVVSLSNHTTLIRCDGSRIPIEDSAAPIKNSAGEIIGAVMVFHDVSERRQKEIALEQASQAKDLFLAALSHELRTPLTPVLAILSSLRQDSGLPAELAEDLETVKRNVELEARLIDDLLDLTRITRGKLELNYERVRVGELIEDAINTCLLDLRAKHLSLIRELEDARQTLIADGARIIQILWNLLKNSIKFTQEGGVITVRSHIIARGDGEQMVIEVQDTGIGIEPAHLDRVFQAFEQGDRKITRQFGGLGLGLAISRAIATSHGGTLTASSKGVGSGSTFTLTLPFERTAESVVPQPVSQISSRVRAASSESITQRPLRILLVEDHVDTAAVLARLLGRMGHEVVHAPDVGAALRMAEKEMRSAGIDLVMSDLGLPDGSGLDLMRELAAKYSLRGIALSGFGMDSDLEQSTAAGFARHLIKPLDITVIRSTIAEIMQEPAC